MFRGAPSQEPTNRSYFLTDTLTHSVTVQGGFSMGLRRLYHGGRFKMNFSGKETVGPKNNFSTYYAHKLHLIRCQRERTAFRRPRAYCPSDFEPPGPTGIPIYIALSSMYSSLTACSWYCPKPICLKSLVASRLVLWSPKRPNHRS